jgi:CHAT domain-containing protein/tetratricopeptide (TPR) repeat protein
MPRSPSGARVPRWTQHSRILVVIGLYLVGPLWACAKPQESPATSKDPAECRHQLQPGAKTSETVAAGSQCEYTIALPPASYTLVTVRQVTGSVNVHVISPHNQTPDDRFSDFGKNAVIRISLLAEQAGEFRMIVLSRQTKTTTAWEIQAGEVRLPESAERNRVAAEVLSARADQLLRKGSPDSLKEAIENDDQALKLWQDLNDPEQIRARLIFKGRALLGLHDYSAAREILKQTVAMPAGPEDLPGQETAFKSLGFSYAYLGDAQSAIEAYNRSLEIARSQDDSFNQSVLLSNIARSYRILGSNAKALRALDSALEMARNLDDHSSIAHTLEAIGNVEGDLGEPQKALDAYRSALEELKSAPDATLEAHVKNGMGYVLAGLGNDEQALEMYRAAQKNWLALKDKTGEAYTLNNLGLLYATRHELNSALEQYQRALANLTELHLDRERATVLVNLAMVYQQLGQASKALEYIDDALQAEARAPDRSAKAYILNCKGEILLSNGVFPEAKTLFDQALLLRRDSQDQNGQAESLADIARLHRHLGEYADSRQSVEEALAIIESTRNTLASQQLRLTYFAKKRDYYEFYIDLLMAMDRREPHQGYSALALEATERARSRNLVDSLRVSGIDMRQGASVKTLEEEQAASDRLDMLARRLSEKTAADKADPAAIQEIKGEWDRAAEDYDRVQADIRSQSPRLAALTDAAPVRVADIQRDLLDADTTLLEYWLGAEKSYVWVLGRNNLASFELPPSDTISKMVTKFRTDIVARAQHPPRETAEEYSARVAKASSQTTQDAAELSDVLLKAVAPYLHGARIAIIGDASLLWLPFQVLSVDAKTAADKSLRARASSQTRMLSRSFEIVYLPSLTVLKLLRNDGHTPAPASRLAVFADPVYTTDDPRIHPRVAAALQPVAVKVSDSTGAFALTPSAVEDGPDHYARLRFSRREAEAIAELLPPERRTLELDFAASRATFEAIDWKSYTALHLATHALVNGAHPELSGIVLSLVDEQGKPQDGFLRVHDIYNLRIPVDFVVLSGCRTALGQEIKGEGLVGLSRAFFYAGTRRVVGTLWNVDDQASSLFMEYFYEGMFRKHLSPPGALAAAQSRLSHIPRWHDPYYWAAFVLDGDWK